MAITSIGYDGTVTEAQFAKMINAVGASEYGVRGAGDWAVTAHPTQAQAVQIAVGSGWGHGVYDTSDAVAVVQCNAIASGTRWDLIVARRDWQPPTGATSFTKVTGGTAKTLPPRETAAGVLDEQPLALVQWTAGQTAPTAIVDLRLWVGPGGADANDAMVKDYITRPGAHVAVDGVTWRLAADGTSGTWVRADEGPAAALTLGGLYTALGAGYETPTLRHGAGGRVYLDGALGTNQATLTMTANTPYQIATIPDGYRPTHNKMAIVPTGQGMGGWGRVYLRPDGVVNFETPAGFTTLAQSGFFIDLDDLSWRSA